MSGPEQSPFLTRWPWQAGTNLPEEAAFHGVLANDSRPSECSDGAPGGALRDSGPGSISLSTIGVCCWRILCGGSVLGIVGC